MTALPDLVIEIRQQHVATEAILVEVTIRGTRLGGWKGLPATGRRVELPVCGIYTFDADDRLAGARIYYNRGTVLRQLSVFHEPVSAIGRISILATHPWTIAGRSPESSSAGRPELYTSGVIRSQVGIAGPMDMIKCGRCSLLVLKDPHSSRIAKQRC